MSDEGQGDAQAKTKKISGQLDKLKVMKKKLLASHLESKVPEDDYQETTADYSRQITDLERQLRDLTEISASTEAFVSFAELQPSYLASLWQAANDDHRRRVQINSLPRGFGILYETKSLNPNNSTLFSVLQKVNSENLRLASPTGFEPVLPP